MSLAATVKGWCPGILRPMPSGDGLIVRVRPRCGGFAVEAAAALADLAERLGSGHIDLTRRANLQLRGLTEDRIAALQEGLAGLGMLDRDEEAEAVRNVMVAPLADPAVRSVARSIEQALTTDRRLAALPAKFGLLVDGGAISIAGERADISLAAIDQDIERDMALGLDTPCGTQWLGCVPVECAAELAIEAARLFLRAAARGRMRALPEPAFAAMRAALAPGLSPMGRPPAAGRRRLGPVADTVGIAAPFGRIEAATLRRLAAMATEAGATELRLSPWRTFYVPVSAPAAAHALADGARDIGLIVDDGDVLLRIEACPGAPACLSSSVDARGDALRLAALAGAHGYRGSIHVSGCAKGCARSQPADLVLVGDGGSYGLLHGASTRGAVERTIRPEEFPGLFQEAREGPVS